MTTTSKDQKINLQQDRIHALKSAQINGEREMIEANINPKYKIDKQSAGFVHILTRIKHLNPATKGYNNEDRVVKIHASEFDRRAAQGAFKTYDELEIIHDPRENRPASQEGYLKLMKPDHVNIIEAQSKNVDRAVVDQAKHLAKKEDELKSIAKGLDDTKATLDQKESDLAQREAELNKRLEQLKAFEATAGAPAADMKVEAKIIVDGVPAASATATAGETAAKKK